MATEIGARFIAVVNNAETESFLDMFTAGGFVDDWGRVFTGRAEIQGWSDEEFIGAQGRLTDVHLTHAEHSTTVTAMWTSRRHTGPSRFVLNSAGDKLVSMEITAA